MAISDYNKTKKLEATSFNDASSTVSKAQPVELVGNDYTGFDGFESGSSQLDWESSFDISIDSNSEVYLTNSLQHSSSGVDSSVTKTLSSSISSDNKKVVTSVKIDSQTGNSNDSVGLLGLNNSGSVFQVDFLGNGDISDDGGVIGSWSAGTVYDLEIILDFTNDTYDVVLNGSTISTGTSFSNSASEVLDLRLINDTSASGSTVNAFHDRLTFTSDPEQTVNSGGVIPLNWTNISDAQDIAVYDQNDNLLDYEIEELDTTAETGVLWVYNSWVRDGSTQAQIVYGDNSADTDRQNVTGTWSNTGQNSRFTHHFNETSGDYLDSTSNNVDSSTVTVASRTANGQFGNAPDFDGTDDGIELSSHAQPDADFTLSFWIKPYEVTSSGSIEPLYSDNFYAVQINDNDSDSTNEVRLATFGDNSGYPNDAELPVDEWTQVTLEFDEGNQYRIFVDGTEVSNSPISTTDTNPDGTTQISSVGYDSVDSDGYFNGAIDEVKLYDGDLKSSAWVQAEYDASPRAGQVFFSQQAAESTGVTKTDTAVRTVASANLLTSTETATSTDTATRTSSTANLITATETSESTDISTRTTATANSITANESLTDSSTKTVAAATPLTSADTSTITDPANITQAQGVPLASTETIVAPTVTDSAVITTATVNSLTTNESLTDSVSTTSATANSLTSSQTAESTDTSTLTTASAQPLTSTQTTEALDQAQITVAKAELLTTTEFLIKVATGNVVTAEAKPVNTNESLTESAIVTTATANVLVANQDLREFGRFLDKTGTIKKDDSQTISGDINK